MFIPVSMQPPSDKPSKYAGDMHVSLEQVNAFFIREKSTNMEDRFIVVAAPGVTEYYVTKETYDLLKSLVLRP